MADSSSPPKVQTGKQRRGMWIIVHKKPAGAGVGEIS